MNHSRSAVLVLSAAAVIVALVHPAVSMAQGFAPRVPISAFGLPQFFDPSRLHVSTSISVGSGGWSGTNGLQTTTFSYSFKAPVAMSLSLGNTWGQGGLQGRPSFFLQGFNLAYQPSRSFMVQIQYQDLRSPLQLQPYGAFHSSPWGAWGP